MSRRAIIMTIAKFEKAVIVGIVAVLVPVAIGVFGLRSRHNQCCICGVQEYERSFMGFVVESLCEREYDEYRTYAEWKKLCGKNCSHQFEPVRDSGTVKDLKDLEHTQRMHQMKTHTQALLDKIAKASNQKEEKLAIEEFIAAWHSECSRPMTGDTYGISYLDARTEEEISVYSPQNVVEAMIAKRHLKVRITGYYEGDSGNRPSCVRVVHDLGNILPLFR